MYQDPKAKRKAYLKGDKGSLDLILSQLEAPSDIGTTPFARLYSFRVLNGTLCRLENIDSVLKCSRGPWNIYRGMLVNEQAKACIITYSTRFPERWSVRLSSKRPTNARQRITVAKDRGTYGRGIEPTVFACSSHV